MTVESQTVTATKNPDGTGYELVASFTPGAGEVYYVDNIVIASDGAGSTTTNLDLKAGYADANIGTTDASTMRSSMVGVSTAQSVDTSSWKTATATLGYYLTEEDTLHLIYEGGGVDDTAATIYMRANLRRVL